MILAKSIASLIATCIIGTPTPAFGDDEGKTAFGEGEGAPAEADRPTKQLGVHDKVQGEEAPDFSFLDEKYGGAKPEAKEDGKAEEETPPEEKPAAGKPPKLEIKDPNEDLEVPPVKPEEEEPLPDPKEHAQKAEAERKAKATEEAEKKKTEDAAKAKAEAEKKPEIKLPTIEEVDAMSLPKGANARTIEDFKTTKEKVIKPALNRIKELEGELAEARKTGITPEIQAKLAQAEDDRVWREAFELNADPKTQKEFTEKLGKADDTLIGFLQTHPRLKLNDAAAKTLKDEGLDTPEGMASRREIIKAVQKLDDPFLTEEVMQAFRDRDAVVKEHSKRMDVLKGTQADLIKAKEEAEKTERTAWASQCDKEIIAGVKDIEMFLGKDLPENASEAEKKAITEHNERLMKETVPKIHECIRAVYQRDPAKTMAMMIAHVRLPEVLKEVDKLKADLEKANKRITELNGDTTRMKRITPSQTPGETGKAVAPVNTDDMSAEDAVDAYRKEKGLMAS